MKKTGEIFIDMWYGDETKVADKVKIFFNDLDSKYFGYIYKGGKVIGDFWCSNGCDLEKCFPHLHPNWR